MQLLRIYLPFVAIVLGAVMVGLTPTPMVTFFAAMLITCGTLVIIERYRANRERALSEFAETESGLVRLTWRDAYRCGHPLIDEQHRNLFQLGNTLIQAVITHQPKQEIVRFLDRMVQDIETHFAAEEIELARARFPHAQAHREVHHSLLERARALRDHYAVGDVPVSDLVGFVAYDVVSEHILKEDLKTVLGPPQRPA